MPKAPSIPVLCRKLASPATIFWCLPWLMVILTLGTLAQADIGLYEAHHKYFASFILWLGLIPLPGAYLALGLITVSLTIKFLLSSPWEISRLGTTLTHLGVLLLLYGGLATALTQEEGFMVIAEGDSASTISDYHERVLKISRDGELVRQILYANIKENTAIDGLPFTLTPIFKCYNCSANTIEKSDETRHGMAQKIDLIALENDKNDELNLSGLMFHISGAGDQDGLYASLEDVPMLVNIEQREHVYTIQMGRRVTDLPFAIQLEGFHKDVYPGTNTPRAYASDVTILDGDIRWSERIEMNEPLRYRGYTFYQSSFTQGPNGEEKTVLSAVQNKGRLFPYIASAIIFAGLCVHLWQRLSGRRRMT